MPKHLQKSALARAHRHVLTQRTDCSKYIAKMQNWATVGVMFEFGHVLSICWRAVQLETM
eukprot:17739-Heterococcus_DN1.PRE.2